MTDQDAPGTAGAGPAEGGAVADATPTGGGTATDAGQDAEGASQDTEGAGQGTEGAARASGSAARATAGAGTLAVLALAWLAAMLSSARQAIGDSPEATPLTVARAALELPQVISASLIAGVAVGLLAGNLLSRFGPPTALRRPLSRFATGAGAGGVTGVAVAAPVLLGYDGLPTILVLSGAVATAATLGGLLSGVRHRAVVAAGTCGALGVFAVALLEQAFQGNLRQLLGVDDSPQSQVVVTGWLVLVASLVAGTVAGAIGYTYLRRRGPAGLRWPAYLVAGAMPGLLVLLAELVTRLGGARLFHLVSAASDGDEAVLSYFHVARLNRALIVVFVGALVAIYLLGRTLRPETAARQAPPEKPAGEPADGEVDQEVDQEAEQEAEQRRGSAQQRRASQPSN